MHTHISKVLLYVYFQTIHFTIGTSTYLVAQHFYSHTLTWNTASVWCNTNGYHLWNMGSSDEWLTVTKSLSFFMLAFNNIPIDLQCNWIHLLNKV